MSHHDMSEADLRVVRSDPANFVYGVICLFCFLIGTSMNAFSLFYFSRKQRHVSTVTYIWIVSTDLLISLLSLPVALSYLAHRTPLLFGFHPVCQAWGVLWNAAARMSVFLVAVLSVSRTVSLRYPFRVIKIRIVVGFVAGYLIVQIVQSTIPYWFGVPYEYSVSHIQCQWFFEDIPGYETEDSGSIIYSVLMGLELVLPVFPVIASCIISILELRHQPSRATAPGYHSNRSATITVILFTCVYVAFNTPFCVYYVLANITRFSVPSDPYRFFGFESPSHNLRAFVVVVSVVLNSSCNPLIYCFRFKKLRVFLVRLIKTRSSNGVWGFDTSLQSQGPVNTCSNLGVASHGVDPTASTNF